MATAFAQNQLNNAQTKDEDTLFMIGSRRRNSVRSRDGPPMTRMASMSSLQRLKAQDASQKKPGSKVDVLVKNDNLFTQFKSDLSSTGSCTGAGAKAILHNFISQKMDSPEVEGSSASVQSTLDATGPLGRGVRRRVSDFGGKFQRRLSMTSLATSLGLDDECVSLDPLQASGDTAANSEILVEFDQAVRRRSSLRRQLCQAHSVQSSSSIMSELSMEGAARAVAAQVDLSDDEKETPRRARRSSIASGRISCLDSVVVEESEDQSYDDESSMDSYISDVFSTSDESLYSTG